MKSLLIASAAFALFVQGSRAQSERPSRPSTFEVRIRQIDLDVALKHYEKPQSLMRDTRLERDLQRGALGANNPEVELTERKMLIIGESIARLKNEIETLNSRLDDAAPASPLESPGLKR